jgi:hypothetical protein
MAFKLHHIKNRYLLIIALCFHLSITASVLMVGRLALFPQAFDATGIAAFASDTVKFSPVVSLAETIKREGLLSWARAPFPLHLKLYSLSFFVFSPLLGRTILSAEPVNVLLYLAILSLIFKLSGLVCGRRASLLATCMVALWPTFLLHTTQLLRDPLFIAVMLVLVLVMARWQVTADSLPAGLCTAVIGAVAATVLWLVRPDMWDLVLLEVLAGGALLALRQICVRRLLAGNIIGAALLLTVALCVPHTIKPYRAPPVSGQPLGTSGGETLNKETPHDGGDQPAGVVGHAEPAESLSSNTLNNVILFRRRFIEAYPDAASNVDADVQFNSAADVARYIPRALLIGLFAPFPRMWLETGNTVGLTGKLIAGFETSAMWVIEFLALFTVWRRRRHWAVWLLLIISLMGALALGLVVVNLGALYRMRYVFWMLLIPLGAEEAVRIYTEGSLGKMTFKRRVL